MVCHGFRGVGLLESATLYEVARSDDPWFLFCSQHQTPTLSWSDPSTPASGAVYYYLVRAYAPYVGSWGMDSNRMERTWVCP